VASAAIRLGSRIRDDLRELTRLILDGISRQIYRLHGPEGVFARTWSTGAIALCALLALWGFLLLYFWNS
jgi:hypothetical protein